MSAVRSFLTNIIDYAGMFPPATLPLEDAFKNYLKYKESPYEWMLAKFVCPAGNLHELEKLADKFSKPPRRVDVSAITGEHLELKSKNISVSALELRPPDEMFNNFEPNKFKKYIKDISAKSATTIFCEIPLHWDYKNYVDDAAVILAEENFGFKLRTGGTSPEAFPSTNQIASVIMTCKDKKLKLKCTAGLHHPVRHYSTEVNAKMHGFLNVFAAGIIAYNREITAEKINEILEDESPHSFKFSKDYFSWKDYKVLEKEISEARKNFITSFGSCSFTEPVDDLKKLQML